MKGSFLNKSGVRITAFQMGFVDARSLLAYMTYIGVKRFALQFPPGKTVLPCAVQLVEFFEYSRVSLGRKRAAFRGTRQLHHMV